MKLSSEQVEFRDLARRIARERLAPLVAIADANEGFDRDAWAILCEHELPALAIPRSHGGLGETAVTGCVVMEQLARGHPSVALSFLVPYLFAAALDGDGELAQRYLPRIATGASLGCFVLTEPDAGSDASSMRTRARRDGDVYIVDGRKHFITNGDVAEVGLLFARTGEVGSTSAFIVEMGSPGIQIGRHDRKMGLRGCSLVEVIFEDAHVPAEQRIGPEGAGMRVALTALDVARVLVATLATGLAQEALDRSIAYTRERTQFGRPVAANQGLQWMMVDAQIAIAAARELALEAARKIDEGEPDALMYASMAKAHCTDVCMDVTTQAVQLHGGYGYLQDYEVERMMRDAKILQIFEGTNQIQRVAVARSIIGRLDGSG